MKLVNIKINILRLTVAKISKFDISFSSVEFPALTALRTPRTTVVKPQEKIGIGMYFWSLLYLL